MSNSINMNIGSAGGISATNLSNLDIETALMAIQSQRASLLEGQLQTQLETVQNRNANIAQLNEVLNAARTLQGYSTSSEAGASLTDGKYIDDKDGAKAAFEKLKIEAEKAGVDVSTVTNQGTLSKAVENLKSAIDSESNSQQMDMLRLQSLSNKRNEAFDLMTNFMKKMQDNRSGLIANMR